MTEPDHHDDLSPDQPRATAVVCGSPFAEEYHAPRLQIIHLLLWTALSAVLLKVHVAQRDFMQSSGRPDLDAVGEVFRTVHEGLLAAGLVGTWVLHRSRVPGMLRRMQPGHWLLATGTLSQTFTFSWWVFATTFLAIERASTSTIVLVFVGPRALKLLALTGIYGTAARRCRDAASWKVYFVILAAICGLQGSFAGVVVVSGWSLSPLNSPLWEIVEAVALLVAVTGDIRHRRGRDWLHWLGVTIVGGGLALWLAWWAWFKLVAG